MEIKAHGGDPSDPSDSNDYSNGEDHFDRNGGGGGGPGDPAPAYGCKEPLQELHWGRIKIAPYDGTVWFDSWLRLFESLCDSLDPPMTRYHRLTFLKANLTEKPLTLFWYAACGRHRRVPTPSAEARGALRVT